MEPVKKPVCPPFLPQRSSGQGHQRRTDWRRSGRLSARIGSVRGCQKLVHVDRTLVAAFAHLLLRAAFDEAADSEDLGLKGHLGDPPDLVAADGLDPGDPYGPDFVGRRAGDRLPAPDLSALIESALLRVVEI